MVQVAREPCLAGGQARAVVLALAPQLGIIQQSRSACRDRDVGERLIVRLADRYQREVPNQREAFERLVRETGGAIRGFLEAQPDPPPVTPAHAMAAVLVFAAMPVAVATGLGAFFSAGGWPFRFMHFVGDRYVEAALP
jgi:hypothetical protein